MRYKKLFSTTNLEIGICENGSKFNNSKFRNEEILIGGWIPEFFLYAQPISVLVRFFL